jgi:superfamily II DNA or RNA helicase
MVRASSSSSSKSNITLHPFQREALISLWALVQRARKRQAAGEGGPLRGCCVQPTGAGKTVEMLCLVREVVARFGWKAIAVEPTRELVRQTVSRAKQFIPHCSFGPFGRGRQFESLDLVVSTAGSLNEKGLSRIDPSHFQLVLIDEAHHAASESYEMILNHFQARYYHQFDSDVFTRRLIPVASTNFQSVVVSTIGHPTGQSVGACERFIFIPGWFWKMFQFVTAIMMRRNWPMP